MSLVDQIFEQARLGTAVDPSANPFATGVQLGQHQQQLNMELAQLPLKQTLLQQDAVLKGAQLEDLLHNRQLEADAATAYNGLAAQVDPLLKAGKIDEAQNAIIAAGADNAYLLADPKKRLHSLFDITTRAQDAKLELLKAKQFSPSVTPLIDDQGQPVLDAGGNPMQYLQKGPGSGEILNKVANLPEEVRASSFLAQKKAELRTLNNQLLETGVGEGSPDTERLKARIAETSDTIDSLEARHNMQEISVETPGGPTVRIGKAQKPVSDITPAETTKYGEDLTATSNALRSVMRLKGQLGSNVVGFSPRVQNVIFDEVLSQFDPGLADKARAAGRQNIRLATQQILGELNNRGRLSNQELQAVKDAMPSLGAAESAPNAQVKLDELSLMLAEKGAAAAQSLKRPVTPEILQSLSDLFPPGKGEQAMAAEVKRGALSRETALQVRKWQKMKGL